MVMALLYLPIIVLLACQVRLLPMVMALLYLPIIVLLACQVRLLPMVMALLYLPIIVLLACQVRLLPMVMALLYLPVVTDGGSGPMVRLHRHSQAIVIISLFCCCQTPKRFYR